MNRILEAGADVNVTDMNGNTALHVMFIQERWIIFPQCVRALLSAGIHVNKVNNEGMSAIQKWLSGYCLKKLKSLITKAGGRFEETIKKRGEDWDIRRRGKEFKVVKLLFATG